MHPRVASLPRPDPDYRRFLAAVRRERPTRVPLLELSIHPEIVSALLGSSALPAGDSPADLKTLAHQRVGLMHRLGYDVVKVSAEVPFHLKWLHGHDASPLSSTSRNWQDLHGGTIKTLSDCDSFAWPRRSQIGFREAEAVAAALPDGMAMIGFAGGVLEYATCLLGLEDFMFAVYDEPELIATVCQRVGETIHDVFSCFCRMDAVCALWLGDDLGGKNGLLVSPDLLAAHVFPWYRRFRDLAHRAGRPFLLHTCGNTAAVMPVLINDIGIDAKHSFEDAIQPVERFMDEWASKVAVLGGVDVNLLSIGAEAAVAARTLAILEHAAQFDGYACGSGNSIPNYVAPANYLTMVETAHRFNGRL